MARSLPILLLFLLAGTGCMSNQVNKSRSTPEDDEAPSAAKSSKTKAETPAPTEGKVVHLEVTPKSASNPVRTKQVLVATIYDKEGKPRRDRKVEWRIDGPGSIVEADEANPITVQLAKADPKYAISTTGYFGHTVSHGKEDITVHPGQTWCVVTSPTEGETTVTVTSPDIADPLQGKVVVKLNWGPGGKSKDPEGTTTSNTKATVGYPTTIHARAGGDAELTTSVNLITGKDSVTDMKVRYRILDGASASFDGRKEVEVPADQDGKATAKLSQPTPQAGTTRVAVELIKSDGSQYGQREASVEWAAAKITLDVPTTKMVAVEREVGIPITVGNAGKVDSSPVTVRAQLPEGVEYLRSEPTPASVRGRELTWDLQALPSGSKQTLTVTLRPAQKGTTSLTALADSLDGTHLQQKTMLTADVAGLKVAIQVPPTVAAGDRSSITVAVMNSGAVPTENATAWVGFDASIEHPSGANPTEINVGTIPPGETKKIEVPLTAKQPGKFPIRVNATADGGLTARTEVTYDVRKPGLFVNLVGPDKLTVGQDATFNLTVTNAGEVEFDRVEVRANLPSGVRAKSAGTNGKPEGENAAIWRTGRLAPGAKETLILTVQGVAPMDRRNLSVRAIAGDKTNAAADAPIEVAGQPTLVLEVNDVPATVPLGKKGTFKVALRNRGSAPAKKIDVSVTVSPEIRLLGGLGADRRPGQIQGDKIVFGTIDELPPNSVAIFTIEMEADQPGPARAQTEVRAEQLRQPLREEHATRIVNR